MPTTILHGEDYRSALDRRMREEAVFDKKIGFAATNDPLFISTADGSGDSLYIGNAQFNMVLQSPYTAFAHTSSIPDVLQKIDRDVLYTNAKLFASSPALLTALARLLAQCDRLRLPGQPESDAEKAARAIIDEATGAA